MKIPELLPREDIPKALTLRDYFAGQALEGYLASGGNIDIATGTLFLERARTCYAIADAMLIARSEARS